MQPDTTIDPSRLGYFYVVQLIPDLAPNRLKFGWTADLTARMASHRCSAPTALLYAAWTCPRDLEQPTISAITQYGCIALGNESVDASDIGAVCSQIDLRLKHPRLTPSIRQARSWRVAADKRTWGWHGQAQSPSAYDPATVAAIKYIAIKEQEQLLMGREKSARVHPANASELPDFSQLVLAVRRRFHWNQRRLGEHLGVARNTVSRWERGAEPPIYIRRSLKALLITPCE